MVKKQLSLIIRPKLIWACVIIILSFTAVASYIFKEQERKIRVFTQDKLISALEQTFLLQSKLMDTTYAKDEIEVKLKDARQEIQVIRKENEDLKADFFKYKETVAKENEDLKASKKTVTLDKIVVTKTGKISRVYRNKTFSVDLGSKDNIEEGDSLSVYRDNGLIGKAEVTNVNRKNSTALILPDWKNAAFKKGDEVRFDNK